MKAEMRREMRALLNRMPDTDNVMRSGQACERVCALPEYIDANLVLCYLSFGKELVSDFLCAHALANGKTLAAPRVTPGGHLEVCAIRDMQRDLVPGFLGIREPAPHCRTIPIPEVGFVIVPGLAYDPNGGRLGRGGGHYDRLLGTPGYSAFSCGLVFEEQVVSAVPTEPHDCRVQIIVTDQKVRRIK